MPLTNAAKHIMLNALGTAATQVSLHTGNPGTTGANEVTGGSPAYTRESITWNTAASANLDSSNAPVFDVPAGTTVSYFGLWNGSTFLGGVPLSSAETFSAQGTYTLLDADVNITD